MARKRNTENEIVVSTGSASARRKTTTPRPRRAAATTTEAAAVPAVEESASIQPEPVMMPYEPAHDEIAALAYSYWADRGYQGGSPDDDWANAEQALRSRKAATATV